MKIICAPDSFKDSLSALQAAEAMANGFLRVFPDAEYIPIPMADGGEGSVDAVLSSGGERVTLTANDPLGRSIEASYALINRGNTAFIEMAQASGIECLKNDERNPWNTSSYGTGEVIAAALDRGCEDIIIGIGGSATHDGGSGALSALGFRFLDKVGEPIAPGARGLLELKSIDKSDVHPAIQNCRFRIATDVSNPLLGPEGAAYVYAKQKGADENELSDLDRALEGFAQAVESCCRTDIRELSAAGAAGGIGGGLQGLLEAEVISGVSLIADIVGLERHLEGANLVVTGEGQINRQTDYGKVVVGVAERAKDRNLPVIAITGSLSEGYECVYERGVDAVQVLCEKPCTLEECLSKANRYVTSAAERAARLIKIGQEL